MHLQTWQNDSSTLLPRLDYWREVNILSPITNLCPTFSPHSGSPLLWWVRWEDKRDMGVAFSESSWTDVIEEDEEQSFPSSVSLPAVSIFSSSASKKARGEGKEEEHCFRATPLFSSLHLLLFSYAGGGWNQTSWSRRSWKVSRPWWEFLGAPSEPTWAAKRKSFLSSVREPRDKASRSSDTLTAVDLSCNEARKTSSNQSEQKKDNNH